MADDETVLVVDVLEDLRALREHVTSGMGRAKLNELVAAYEDIAGPEASEHAPEPEVDNEDGLGGPDEPTPFDDDEEDTE